MDRYRNLLRHCHGCPRRCGSNRLAGEVGFCRISGPEALVAHIGLHHGEEPPLSGTDGSGTIFFAGCNLRCVFCQNYQISQEFGPTPSMTTGQLAKAMLRLQETGAHNINFVSPSHMVWPMAEAILTARAMGLRLPVVYNSNGYDSVAALRQIRGLIDIYLPDLKYQDANLAHQYSQATDYIDNVSPVLEEMLAQVGHLRCTSAGIAQHGLLVRHLVLPGAIANSKACLRLLASLGHEVHISLMSQYSPQYKAMAHPSINRPLWSSEYKEVCDYALEIGLENVFVQELSSRDHYLPDFAQEQPFQG